MSEPFQDECRNPDAKTFTTPCCYEDSEQEIDHCPKCGRKVKCSIEYDPVAVCRLVEDEEDDNG